VFGPDAIKAGPADVGRVARDRFAAAATPYWLHLDVDVLDEAAFPATDYLMPGGIDLPQLAELLLPLGEDPLLIGASVGCYNPQKDPDRRCGAALAGVLASALG
jgi:arginase